MNKNKLHINILQPKIKGCEDSFFYEGDIASLKFLNREILIVAEGDIDITDKDGETIFSNHRNIKEPLIINNDKDLTKIDNITYTWEQNNWFSISYKYKNDKCWECYDDVWGCYSNVLKVAKLFIKDNKNEFGLFKSMSKIESILYE